ARQARAHRDRLRPWVPAGGPGVTRRLLATLLAFTAAVLAISVVPLGVVVSQRDRHEFRTSTSVLAQSLATLSEDSFDDRGPLLQASRLRSAAGPGVDVAVLDLAGHQVVGTGARVVGAGALVTAAVAGRSRTAFVGD